MAVRDTLDTVNGARRRAGRQAKLQVKSDPPPAPAQLDYIADLVQQLRAMAAASDQRTLAALLGLAGDEATRQYRSNRKATSRRG